MDIRDPEYQGMLKLSLDRKDEILALQAENKKLKEKIARIKKLQGHYKTIGFTDTAEKIQQALEGE